MLARKSLQLVKNLQRRTRIGLRRKSDGAQDQKGTNVGGAVALPPEPTHCCMSGCPNCVWIKYAQEVTQMFDNGDVIARNKIMEKVQDPKLRAYIFTQLGLNEKN